MIIDCHGHYTTEPKELQAFRKQQVDAAATPLLRPAKASLDIGDDEIRQSIEPSSGRSASAAPTSRSSRRAPPAWATMSAMPR